jgi:glycine cleavage system H protein
MHPDELLYSPDHVWCKNESSGNIRMGMTYHYQEQLKNIVYIDLVKKGTVLKRGSPLSGTVVETNQLLAEKPGLVNKDPYGQGWMAVIKPECPEESDALLSAKKYNELIVR